MVPSRVDGVGRLKPVGEFYYFQAKIAALPAVYLIVWLLIIPAWGPERNYHEWRGPFLGFLAFVLAIEVLSFVVPTWAFHREMAAQKAAQEVEADRLSAEIVALRRRLAATGPDDAALIKGTAGGGDGALPDHRRHADVAGRPAHPPALPPRQPGALRPPHRQGPWAARAWGAGAGGAEGAVTAP